MKKNGLRFVGEELASATPTRRGPCGVLATSGPPLSPWQIDLCTGRCRRRSWMRRNATRPLRPPESQIAHGGSGQRVAKTLVVVSSPSFGLPNRAGFLVPKPATDSGAPDWVKE